MEKKRMERKVTLWSFISGLVLVFSPLVGNSFVFYIYNSVINSNNSDKNQQWSGIFLFHESNGKAYADFKRKKNYPQSLSLDCLDAPDMPQSEQVKRGLWRVCALASSPSAQDCHC